jgi:hypothetical protein
MNLKFLVDAIVPEKCFESVVLQWKWEYGLRRRDFK